MADAEDGPPAAMPPPDEDFAGNATASLEDEDEGEGEGVDFRFLTSSAATASSRGGGGLLPKRGEKDFEPNATQSQRNTLAAGRRAMYDALAAVRVHTSSAAADAGRSHNVGRFVNWDRPAEAEQWRRRVGGGDNDDDDDDGDLAEWRRRWCVVVHFKGVHGKTVGKSDRRGWTWLLPEEALYLLERGSLEIRWPDEEEDDDEEEEKEKDVLPPLGTLPMSLQGAYAAFIGKAGLSLERYLVYAGLKRSGYVVQRAPTWDDARDGHVNGNAGANDYGGGDDDDDDADDDDDDNYNNHRDTATGSTLWHRLLSWLINPRMGTANPCAGPLVARGLYRNYNEVFRALALIPYYYSSSSSNNNVASAEARRARATAPFTISWLVYKPSTPYRKSAPPRTADYRVCVVDARATSVPSMAQIGHLLDTMPDEAEAPASAANQRIEARIRRGRRSVLVAVVDLAVVSYLRFAETELGRYRLYEERARRGGKGKGGGGKARARGKKAAPVEGVD